MSLSITTCATGYFPTFAILQLIGDVLIAWNVCHKPLTLPRIKELLHDGDDVHILPLMNEYYMKMSSKKMKLRSFFSSFYPKKMSIYNTFFIRKNDCFFRYWGISYLFASGPIPEDSDIIDSVPISLMRYFLLSSSRIKYWKAKANYADHYQRKTNAGHTAVASTH